MKKTSNSNVPKDEMKSEYALDYQKAKSNRFMRKGVRPLYALGLSAKIRVFSV